MTREEAIKKIKEAMPTLWKETKEAIQVLIPELAESDDERIRKEMIRYFTEMKKGGSASLPYDDCIAYLESKGSGIKWFKSDNVKNPDKPYIDKTGMFYTTDGKMCHASEIEKQKGQKPTGWSEKDEHIIKNIYDFVKENTIVPYRVKCAEECLEWLKSLPERFNLQSKQEWSKEDENKIERLAFLVSVAEEKEMISPSESIDLRNFIKSLRPQSKKEFSMEKAIKWLDDTFYFLDNSSGRGRDCEITTHDFDSLEEMYDSFRKAVIVDSEPHWKPTEEQMEALKEAAEHSFYAGEGAALRTLYNDLQKRYGTC